MDAQAKAACILESVKDKTFIDIDGRPKHKARKGKYQLLLIHEKEVQKGAWGMPRLSEAMKDAISCDKQRGGANSP